MSWRLIAGVALGGAIGALARAALLSDLVGQTEAALVGINIAGSFLLGFAAVRLVDSRHLDAAVGVGFCGGFTSMSSFALDVAHRLSEGHIGAAALLLISTAGFAVGGAALGLRSEDW